MEPTHLLPLLASLQMLPRPVSSAAQLFAPELTVSPQYRIFLRGESVTLTCSAPSTATVSGIRFFRDGRRIGSGELQWSYYRVSASLLLSNVSESNAGVYSCESWRTESGQEVPLQRSQNISIAVTDQLSAPELTVSPPHRIFLRGESVTLMCSAPRIATVTRIRFLRDGKSIDSRKLQWFQDKVSSLQVWSVSESHAGVYSCEYWKTESGREIPSERSQNIPITVTDWLSVLELTLSSPYPVLLRGESVTLTCSAHSTDTVSGIRFFRDGRRIGSGELQWSHYRVSTSLLLSNVSESNAGVYSCESWRTDCEYWKTESGREIPSERSQNIPITVTDWLSVLELTLSSPYPVLLRGESVTLTCSAHSTDTVSGIRFFRDGRRIGSGELQWSHYRVSTSLLLSNVSESNAGVYSCESWRTESGQEVPLQRSQNISIAVTARPPAPEFTVSPQYRVFLRGESVILTCSAPSTANVSGIRFFRDGWRIIYRELQWSQHNTRSFQLSSVLDSEAGTYSCDYLKTESVRKIPSERSENISIAVTALSSVPKLTLSSPYPILLHGESVNLTCSAPRPATVSSIWFFRDGQRIGSRMAQRSQDGDVNASLLLSNVSQSHTGLYSCESWRTEPGREIPSERSRPLSIAVTDPPPRPELSVDPPSGVMSEGCSLNVTCTAPGDARERKFHFYKDGVKLVPGDLGSEISTVEPSTSSVNVSVLIIPWASPNITGDYTCGYEENMSGRWIQSARSLAGNVVGNVTMPASYGDILLGTGGVLLLIAALAALLCYWHRKKRVPKTPKTMEGVELGERPRNLDPAHDSKGSKATDAGAEEAEQDSEVTYALLVLPSSPAHTTQLKNKATPVEDEHVLYSEVVTIRTQKKAK
nr:obscurin-like [Pelodiscus sinensis]|eukprot:XP_025040343.1 obscurin-like [Pelodiscus sinensis]